MSITIDVHRDPDGFFRAVAKDAQGNVFAEPRAKSTAEAVGAAILSRYAIETVSDTRQRIVVS